MNGFLKTTVAGLFLGAGFTLTGFTLVGCSEYRQMVDPCWPDRYSAESRMSVRETFGAQAHNGHILDQTVWNYHFEADPRTGGPTDKLNVAGMEHLKYLARRLPTPDPNLYLQTAQDVSGSASLPPEKWAQARSDLDNRRVAAIQRYLASMMSGRSQAVSFEVAIHDQAEPGINATPIAGNLKNPVINGAIPQHYQNYKGRMPGPDSVIMTTSGGS
jgi:hypothetical protein